MSRRLVAAGVALVLLALVAGGAFGGVFAADTTGSGLAIDAADGPNGDYADLSNDRITLDLSGGGGVSNDAVTKLDAVFTVTNDRSYAAPVWVSDNSSALGFYDTETGNPVDSREAARNLSAGETLRVGVTVDMRDASVEDVESTGGFVVETLVEDATTGTDTSGGDSGTEASGGTDAGTQTSTGDGSTTETSTGGTATATATQSGSDDGQQAGGSESEFTVYDTSEGATVKVREGVNSDPFTADLTDDTGASYASGADTNVTEFSTDLTFDREGWRVEVTNPTAEPQEAPSVDGDVVSYFRADAIGVEASAFDSIGVNATVSLPDGAAAEDVAFYRHTADGWQRVSTTHHGGDRFGADLGGFGEVAVVVESGGSDGGDGGTDGDSDGTDGGASGTDGTNDGTNGGTGGTTTTEGSSGSTDGTATPTPTEDDSADPIVTGTATAVERLEEPVTLDSGLGGATVLVFGLFTLWLAARGRVGGGGSNGGL